MVVGINKAIKNAVTNLEDKIYSTARISARVAYITLPATAYAITSKKVEWLENLPILKKALAYIFCRGDIDKLYQHHNYFTYGTGAASALIGAHFFNRGIEKVLGDSYRARSAKILGSFTAANIANAALHGIKKGSDLLDIIAVNGHDSLMRAQETITHLMNGGENSDYQMLANGFITTLLSIGTVQLAQELTESGIAGKTYDFVRGLGSVLFYPVRKMSNLQRQFAQRRVIKDKQNKLVKLIQKEQGKRI